MSIQINLKIFLFAILFYITRQIHLYALIMLFAFCHEMGHLLCGLFMGLKPKALKIMPMGLSVEFKVLPEEYNKKVIKANRLQLKKIWIALAGPLTNLLLIIVAVFIKHKIENELYLEIIYSNLLIAIFNLLPIYPLDGARILKGLFYIAEGRKKSEEHIYLISNISVILLTMASSIAIYYYENIAILFIILYLWGILLCENKRYHIKRRIHKIIENG